MASTACTVPYEPNRYSESGGVRLYYIIKTPIIDLGVKIGKDCNVEKNHQEVDWIA